MKRLLILTAVTTILIGTAQFTKSFAEVIFLKDGSIHKGRIISQSANKMVFKKTNRKIVRFKNSSIMRTLYTELYMGRQYIRLTNGKVIKAYKVDEDSKSMTFRKDITKPKEFTLARSKILFIARNNPNELAGKADFTDIDLTWQAPVGSVKRYHIYVRLKDDNSDYPKEFYAKTNSVKHTISGLKSSTKYCIVVKALNSDDSESMPSNEIELSTKNYHPEKPEALQYYKGRPYKSKKKLNKIEATIKWKAATDSDGTITKYFLYIKKKDAENYEKTKYKISKKLSTAKTLIWKFQNLEIDTEYDVKIQAVDNFDALSEFSHFDFSTINKNPNRPERITLDLKKNSKKNYILRWEKPLDPDGEISKYYIYERTPNGNKKIGETTSETFTINNLSEKPILLVQAIDDRGGISDIDDINYFHVSVQSLFILPIGEFGNLYGMGAGALLNAYLIDIPFNNIKFGIRTGYFHFTKNHEAFERYTMIPLLATADYSYFTGNWVFSASLSLGASYNTATYNRYVLLSDNTVNFYDLPVDPKSSIQPLIAASVKAGYVFDFGLRLDIAAEYNAIVESALHSFVTTGFGFGINF